jgi:hypothetical protein
VAFNREHILLQALGRLEGEPVVIHSVCQECNDYFGRTFDLLFARGSIEALLRIELGLKPTDEVTDLLLSRLAFQYPLGSYRGLWLEPVHCQGRIVLRPLPQAGLTLRGGGGWRYITLRDLRQLAQPPDDVDPTGLKRAIAMTQDHYDEVMAELRRIGLGFTPQEPLPIPEQWGEAQAEVTAEVDIATRRCVAKMAFNYLAAVMGPDFVLNSDFDPIRHFIREGTDPAYRIVTESHRPILADDDVSHRQTRGHLIVVQPDDQTGELVCLFSPFNEITYRVVLRRNSSGALFNFGHHYDLETRRVTPLASSSLLVLRRREF